MNALSMPHATALATAPRRRSGAWLWSAGLLLCLGACQTGPQADVTRTAIGDEMQKAREQRGTPPPLPESVSRALLPPLSQTPLLQAAAPEQRFDLSVTNAPATQVFQAIASGSRYSVLLSQNVSGTVTISLKEVTVHEALDVLRELYGYEYRIEGNKVFVQAAGMQTKMFQVSYPASHRVGRSDTRVVSGSIQSNSGGGAGGGGGGGSTGGGGGGGTTTSGAEGSQVSTSTDVEFWKELDASLKALVGVEGGRQVVLSQHSGVIVVRALPRELREVEHYLRAAKLSIERQVMLEAKIVEVSLSDGYESGINWAHFNEAGNHRWSAGADQNRINVPGSLGRQYGVQTGSLATTVDTTTSPPTVISSTLGQLVSSPLTNAVNNTLGLAFTSNSFTSLLAFLETQGSVQVLSSPRVAAINNQKAVLRVGTDDFFITNISTTTTSSATGTVTTPSITVQPFFSGISLDVTPQIDEEGNVTLHIRPSVSVVTERSKVVNLGTLGNFTLPLASSNINETDTVVRVRDGVTVAIGGLMQQSQSDDDARVPLAGDLPVVGNLFKRTNRSLRKRELVFLLRPTVIKGDTQWQADLASAEQRLRGMNSTPRERLPLPTVGK
ncbi:MAG: pilus (MSHA type) biogenesis protein MshL [Pseudomonadota bacterium]